MDILQLKKLMIMKIFIVYIEEKGVNKYLVFDSMELHSIDENKELLKNTVMFLMELETKSKK